MSEQREEVKIVIPSHKRADRILTTKVVSNCILCVPESQKDDYVKNNPDVEILAHPDSIIGLTAKRQWICEKYNDVFMLDDDINALNVRYFENKQIDGSQKIKDPDMAYELIQNLYRTAKEMDCKLFGFTKDSDIRNYKPQNPFSFTGLISGGAFGHIGFNDSKLFYDTDQKVVEDYWISLLNMYHYRYLIIDNRFSFVASDTFLNQGGCSEYRNVEQEKKDYIFLKKMFGDSVKRKKATKRASLRHKYMRTINRAF